MCVRVVDTNARYVLLIVRAAAKSDRSLARCGTELALTLCSDAREPQLHARIERASLCTRVHLSLRDAEEEQGGVTKRSTDQSERRRPPYSFILANCETRSPTKLRQCEDPMDCPVEALKNSVRLIQHN
ncbi:hypothetical protein CBL_00763 [Carabus blaptoides fortunei]